MSETEVTKRIGELMHELQPDVVHAHNVHAHIGYPALRSAREITRKIFLTAHDTFLVSYDRVGGKQYREAARKGKAYALPWYENIGKAGRKYWPARNRRIKKILSESGTNIVTYTRAMREFLEENDVHVSASVSGAAPMIALPDEQAAAQWKRERSIDGPCILFGARISEDKGIVALLRAAAIVREKVPAAVFLILGEEERLQPFLSGISEDLRERIRTTGWMPYEDLPFAYAAADIVTTPSIYLDNFPTMNLEAMAMGKPVVGTCFGGTPEAVEDGVTGIIVDPTESGAFAHALTTLLTDAALARKMGEAGRKRVSERFSMEKQAREYVALYGA